MIYINFIAKFRSMVVMQKMKVGDVLKLKGNPRKITQEEMECLKESLISIPEYMEAHPIVLSDRTGEWVVIDGNQRLEAARQLGWKEVPTAKMSGLSEEKEREIIIRANVNNGEWDMDLLQEWDKEQLQDWGVSVEWEEEKQQSQKDLSDELNFDYKLEITCNDEVEQQSLFNEFQERGIVCRILTL